MRLRHAISIRDRLGATMAASVAILPAMFGFMAISVDTAVLTTSKAQLQNAADAAALAGAAKLASQTRLRLGLVTPADVVAAKAQAVDFGARNRVLGKPAVLVADQVNPDTKVPDITVGRLSQPSDPKQEISTAAAALPGFNAVQVRASRSKARGGDVPGFFSGIFPARDASGVLNVRSTAAVLGASGFRRVDGSARGNCLPIVLDKVTYAAMLRNETTDQYTFHSATGLVTAGPDGITESQLYPVKNGYPGNWGTVKIGVSNNSTSVLGDQIRYGITPAQMATYPGGVLQPDPATGVIVLGGNPGISAGIKDDLAAIIGKPVRIPIFDPLRSGGNGNNASYTIVAFAPVRIMATNFQGSNKYVIIQPAPGPVDPTVVWGAIESGVIENDFRLALVR